MSSGASRPEQKHFKNINELGDAILKTTEDRDYVRELAEHNLILARLTASESTNAKVKSVLGNLSEEEKVLHQVLAKINNVSESSAEYAQLMRLTGMKSRIDIAKHIAAQVWDKHSRKAMYAPFTPSDSELASDGGIFGNIVAALRGSG